MLKAHVACHRFRKGTTGEQRLRSACSWSQPQRGRASIDRIIRVVASPQAYRYLQEAQELAQPLPVAQPTIPVTIKIPGEVVGELRAYAQESGRTMGEIVGCAVSAYLAKARQHG